ncbi:MAG TPA: hypothetical protein VGN57_14735 [Pirellulaceae bacterium]|jgi:hypothetical protein|nr:hypothetical protein [Pirellulaceae bacterium]
MLRFALAATAAFLLSTMPLTSTVTRAQEPPQVIGSVEVGSYKATKVKKLGVALADAGFNGARGVFSAPQGKAFLVLNLELKPTFAADPNGQQVALAEHGAVTLTLEGSPPAWSIGSCDPHGRFATLADGYAFYPSDQPFVGGYDPVFLVPADASGTATLTLGPTKDEITISEAVQDQIDPTQAIQLQVDATKTATELQRPVRLGVFDVNEEIYPQQIVSRAGRFALVSIVMKPKVRNWMQGYSGNIQDFGLLLGKEVYLRPIGVYDAETFSEYASDFSFEQDALGDYNAGRTTLVFPLPGAVSAGKLLYLGAPIANLTFGD